MGQKGQQPQTLVEKIWQAHLVERGEMRGQDIVYVDLHLIHELTSAQAFDGLKKRRLKVHRPDLTIATLDHVVPTKELERPIVNPWAALAMRRLRLNAKRYKIRLYDIGSQNQGIVHVIGPELGLTRPGMTVVCGDSHTATHGALAALGLGVGTAEVEMVLATQCLLSFQPKPFEIRMEGKLAKGVTAKDAILEIIRQNGVNGGIGYAFEYTGSAVAAMTMEERMTLCNMSVEGGARAGLVGVDDTTLEYLKGRRFTPKGKFWSAAERYYRSWTSDPGAVYARRLRLKAQCLEPMVTYGTNPGMVVAVSGRVPRRKDVVDKQEAEALIKALQYMGLRQGQSMLGQRIDNVFIGSCTNARLSDLEAAAVIVRGRKVAPGVKALVVPGSTRVKKLAEAVGLNRVFQEAGFEWRSSGCSACLGVNDDRVPAGKYCASTSSRNFAGRQGRGARTILMSPIMAAAAATAGKIVDVREWL